MKPNKNLLKNINNLYKGLGIDKERDVRLNDNNINIKYIYKVNTTEHMTMNLFVKLCNLGLDTTEIISNIK